MIFPFFLDGKRGRKEEEALDDRGKELLAPHFRKKKKGTFWSLILLQKCPFRTRNEGKRNLYAGWRSIHEHECNFVRLPYWYILRHENMGSVRKIFPYTHFCRREMCVRLDFMYSRRGVGRERPQTHLFPFLPSRPLFPTLPMGEISSAIRDRDLPTCQYSAEICPSLYTVLTCWCSISTFCEFQTIVESRSRKCRLV